VYQLLGRILSPALVEDDVEDESKRKAGDERVVSSRQGGVGVCASGLESPTREAANAVARPGPVHAVGDEWVGLHFTPKCFPCSDVRRSEGDVMLCAVSNDGCFRPTLVCRLP
jgi:hypothetical protein